MRLFYESEARQATDILQTKILDNHGFNISKFL